MKKGIYGVHGGWEDSGDDKQVRLFFLPMNSSSSASPNLILFLLPVSGNNNRE